MLNGQPRTSWRYRLSLIAALIVALSLLVPSAQAGRSIKHVTFSIAPTNLDTGTNSLLTATVAVTSDSTVTLGSGQLDFTGFSNVALDCSGSRCGSTTVTTSSGHTWKASAVGALVQLFASAGTQKMLPGESLSVGVWVLTPCSASTIDVGGSPNTVFKPSTDLSGTSVFTLVGGSSIITVVQGPNQPTKLHILSVLTPAGSTLPVVGQPFNVGIQSENDAGDPAPVCSDTLVTLSGSANLSSGATSGTIPAGQSGLTISGVIDTQVENFTLVASAAGLSPGSFFLQILATSVVCGGGGSLTSMSTLVGCPSFGAPGGQQTGASGAGTLSPTDCDTTSSNPVCVVTVFPLGTGPGTATLGLGTCAGYFGLGSGDCLGQLIRWLPDLHNADGSAIYTKSSPWTMVVECDKLTCAGKGVASYTTLLDGNDDGSFLTPPACLSSDHDIIDPSLTVTLPDGTIKPAEYCVDYVESHRDGAGDLVLVVHLTSEPDGGGIIHR